MNVGPIDTDQFASFLNERFLTGKRTVDESVLGKVFQWADNIPGDVQQLCAALWEITSYRDHITEELLPAALERIYARESKAYEAVGISAAASVQRALNRLEKLKVLYRHQGRYKFVNPFFKSWLIYKDF